MNALGIQKTGNAMMQPEKSAPGPVKGQGILLAGRKPLLEKKENKERMCSPI